MPTAVVEAKDNNYEVGDGMQQAIEYAEHLDVPSVFTSNGDSFVWHDRSGIRPEAEVEIGFDEFPSPEELYTLYEQWKGIDDPAIEPLLTSQFYDDGSGRRPRYYQRIAVNRVMERIAAGIGGCSWSWRRALARPTQRRRSSGASWRRSRRSTSGSSTAIV